MATQHLIQPQDDLRSIALQYLNDEQYWRELATYNNLGVFDQLPIGRTIDIPSLSDAKQIASAALTQVVSQVSTDLGIPDYLDLSSIKQIGSAQNLISWIVS
jgi:predicted TIM-barrel enzyme